MLEPVDADYRPTPVGERSHTVLISNLANRVQPVLRYDLGDSVLQRSDPCPAATRCPRSAHMAALPTCSPSPPTAATTSLSRRWR